MNSNLYGLLKRKFVVKAMAPRAVNYFVAIRRGKALSQRALFEEAP
jgi:hypothetical protein